jgi:hypothetical protein
MVRTGHKDVLVVRFALSVPEDDLHAHMQLMSVNHALTIINIVNIKMDRYLAVTKQPRLDASHWSHVSCDGYAAQKGAPTEITKERGRAEVVTSTFEIGGKPETRMPYSLVHLD